MDILVPTPKGRTFFHLYVLGMKSKLGENFLSLQCKDSTSYPLPPLYLIFTDLIYCYLNKQNLQTPSLPLSLHCKDRKFHPVLTRSLRCTCFQCTSGQNQIWKIHCRCIGPIITRSKTDSLLPVCCGQIHVLVHRLWFDKVLHTLWQKEKLRGSGE